MKIISVEALAIPDIKIIKFERFCDNRGYFTESYRKSQFNEFSMFFGTEFKQANESFSGAGVLRGLHFQYGHAAMGKLVRTIRGHMHDIVLDIRVGSPYFGKVLSYNMPSKGNEKHGEWIWVPPGFAHGNFFTEDTVIEYFCTAEHAPGYESGICPFSPELDWSLAPIKERIDAAICVVSEKDQKAQTLTEWLRKPESNSFRYSA